MKTIDLHTHSTASDGTCSPAEIVRAAAGIGLAAVALTDHDTTAGLPEAREAGREHGVEIVNGCELSVVDGARRLHILGLFLPENPVRLEAKLAELREKRHDRNRLIIQKLRDQGVDVAYDEVSALAEGAVGRPHIARALLAKNAVTSIQQAFDRYLGNHGSAYVPKAVFPVDEAMAMLTAEGATVSLAHPCMLGLAGRDLEELARRYKAFGLDCVEAHYSEHSKQQTREYLALAERLDLGVSGGSDFHGSVKPKISLGRGRGGLRIPYAVLEALKARRAAAGLAA